jgi:hypothetical protein
MNCIEFKKIARQGIKLNRNKKTKARVSPSGDKPSPHNLNGKSF